jgi:hypothetical protein
VYFVPGPGISGVYAVLATVTKKVVGGVFVRFRAPLTIGYGAKLQGPDALSI